MATLCHVHARVAIRHGPPRPAYAPACVGKARASHPAPGTGATNCAGAVRRSHEHQGPQAVEPFARGCIEHVFEKRGPGVRRPGGRDHDRRNRTTAGAALPQCDRSSPLQSLARRHTSLHSGHQRIRCHIVRPTHHNTTLTKWPPQRSRSRRPPQPGHAPACPVSPPPATAKPTRRA
jgi:hypothetical protein